MTLKPLAGRLGQTSPGRTLTFRRMIAVGLIASMVFSSSCQMAVEAVLPVGAEPFAPPPEYVAWWDIVPGGEYSPLFGIEFQDGRISGATFLETTPVAFHPRETKRVAVDVGGGMRTGEFTLRGWFNSNTTAVRLVRIRP